MNAHRMVRLAAASVAGAVLLLPVQVAAGADDPVPPNWPKVRTEQAGNTESDPKVQNWPEVPRPAAGTQNDPKPPDWPQPAPA